MDKPSGQAGEEYNIAAIRSLIEAAFIDKELRRFLDDQPAFRPVLKSLPSNAGLADMADAVIDYCRTRLLFTELLDGIRQVNERQFLRYESQLKSAEPANGSVPGSPHVVHLRVYGEPPHGLPAGAKRLDWHQEFDVEAVPRRIPDPATWRDKLLPQLKRLKKKIGAPASIRLEGSASLASGFAFGHTFRAVAQYHLQVVQTRGGIAECWGSDEQPPSGTTAPRFARYLLPGDPTRDDAVVMVLALPVTRPEAVVRDVGTYWDEPDVFAQGLQSEVPPVAGAEPVASRQLKGAMLLWADVDPTQGRLASWEAAALARTSVAQIREFVGQTRPAKIHLFLATPIGLAVFLGHQWNAVGVTAQCYEKVGGARVYAPACALELS